MKTLKFNSELVEPMLRGEKTTTWRLFDDKGISVGDLIECIDRTTGNVFARIEVIFVREKPLGAIQESDFEGHNRYMDRDDMLRWYQEYYGENVSFDSVLKMISFKITHS